LEKDFKTIDEQIEILKSRNIIVENYDKVYKILEKNNCYIENSKLLTEKVQ
jgi:abortive infection bacteriophage resistance protein